MVIGKPPEVNLINEKNNGEIVYNLISENLIVSAHDISNGGLIIALSEMSLSSNFGFRLEKMRKLRNFTEYLFGEDQARYVLEVEKNNVEKVEKILNNSNIYFEKIGFTQEKYFEIEGEFRIDINDLFKINNQWYNNY